MASAEMRVAAKRAVARRTAVAMVEAATAATVGSRAGRDGLATRAAARVGAARVGAARVVEVKAEAAREVMAMVAARVEEVEAVARMEAATTAMVGSRAGRDGLTTREAAAAARAAARVAVMSAAARAAARAAATRAAFVVALMVEAVERKAVAAMGKFLRMCHLAQRKHWEHHQ